MKSLSRGLGLPLVAVVLLLSIGCGEDNEKVSNITSAPPPAGAPQPAKSQAEQFQRQQGTGGMKNYPGANNRR
jgi:hypothetical protein